MKTWTLVALILPACAAAASATAELEDLSRAYTQLAAQTASAAPAKGGRGLTDAERETICGRLLVAMPEEARAEVAAAEAGAVTVVQRALVNGKLPDGTSCHLTLTFARNRRSYDGDGRYCEAVLYADTAKFPLWHDLTTLMDGVMISPAKHYSGLEAFNNRFRGVALEADRVAIDEVGGKGFELRFHSNGHLKSFEIKGWPFMREVVGGPGFRWTRRCDFAEDAALVEYYR